MKISGSGASEEGSYFEERAGEVEVRHCDDL